MIFSNNNRNVTYLSLSDFISSYGNWLFTVAIYEQVYRLTGSPISLGISFCISIIPQLLFSLISIKIPDKINQKHLMIFLDLFRAFIILFCIYFVAIENVLGIFLIQFICAGANSIFLVMKNYLIKSNAENVHINKQISILRYYYELSLVLGALTAGYMMSRYGFADIVFLDSATFVVSALLLLLYRYKHIIIKPLDQTEMVSATTGIKRCLKMMHGCYSLIISKFIYVFGVAILNMLPALLTLKIYKLPSEYIGYYFATLGAGSALGAFHNSTGKLLINKGGRIILFGIVSVAGLGLLPWLKSPLYSMVTIGVIAYAVAITFINIESEILSCESYKFKYVNIVSQSSFFLSVLFSVMIYSTFLKSNTFAFITTVYAVVAMVALTLVPKALKNHKSK